MEARHCSPRRGALVLRGLLSMLCLVFWCDNAWSQQGRPAIYGMSRPAPGSMNPVRGQPHAGHSENFIVLCRDPRLAQAVSQAAERLRRELAVHWLGEELPNWSERCPIEVVTGPNLGAGGETRFTLYNGNVGHWSMSVQGTPERILDSVLPHEITHTIFASYFAPLNTHVPRWADEGACTTVEHSSEQNKHKTHLLEYLSTGRGLSFNRMFSLVDYPRDILPLYAQGHSVVEFLIEQGGPRQFVQFLQEGMESQQWEKAVTNAYGYETLGQLQVQWNQWIADGRGSVDSYAGKPRSSVGAVVSNVRPASVPSLELTSPVDQDLNVAEGASVALASFEKSSSFAASTVAPSPTLVDKRAAGQSGQANETDGYFRQRLESNLRDVIRVVPGKNSAIQTDQPIYR